MIGGYNNVQSQYYMGPCFIPHYYGRSFHPFVPPMAVFPLGYPGDPNGRPRVPEDGSAPFGCPIPTQVPLAFFQPNLPGFGFPLASTPWFAGIPPTHHFRRTQSIPFVHHLLGGEYGREPKMIFDLSLHTFRPQYITRNSSHGSQLRLEELSEPAIYPSVHRLEIVCDHLLEWPITIERRLRTSQGASDTPTSNVALDDTPITVYDVLTMIYRTLQTPISSRDWEKLLGHRQRVILEAYTRRCRRYTGLRWTDDVGGIRRVDYLKESYLFGGLVCECARDGVAKMKLLLSTSK